MTTDTTFQRMHNKIFTQILSAMSADGDFRLDKALACLTSVQASLIGPIKGDPQPLIEGVAEVLPRMVQDAREAWAEAELQHGATKQ